MSYSSIRLHIKYIKWMGDDASAEELEATETTKAGDDRLHDVEEGVDGLGEATGRGALLRLLEKRLEGGRNLLEGRNNSTEGTTKGRLEALHDLAHLAEDIVYD